MPLLQVEVRDDEISVTQSGSKFRAIYHFVHHMPDEQPQLLVKGTPRGATPALKAAVRNVVSRSGLGMFEAVMNATLDKQILLKEPNCIVISRRFHPSSNVWHDKGRSHSSSFDQRRRPDTLWTAIATAFFWPTSTTSRLPRVTPV